MNVMDSFMAYAKEFEVTYDDDEWQRLEKYFADDAVYEVKNTSASCHLEGPAAIFIGIKKSLDNFDRRMDSRKIELTSPPIVDGNALEISWAVIYTLGDAPPLRVCATTTTTLRDDGRIVHMEDVYDDGQDQYIREWLMAHAPTLNPAYE